MDVKLPKLGEGADSGVVVNIFVKEGDEVALEQPILELENEKAVASIPSTAAGKVTKIFVKTGDKISVGAKLISVSGSGAEEVPPPAAAIAVPAEPEPQPAQPSPASPAAAAASLEDDEDFESKPGQTPAGSPTVRRVAKDLGIDLRRIKGSERGGRVIMSDLKAYVQRLERLVAQAKAGGAQPARTTPERIDFSKWGPITVKPLSPLRQVISRRMSESWQAVPRVTQFDEADVTSLLELRKKFAPAYEQRGTRLTLTSFILRAVVLALQKHPIFNTSLDHTGENLVFKSYVNVGMAVDTEAGLMVPVIKDADKKSLIEISRELEELAKKARDRKISGEDLKGGSFTISNQGAIGGGHFTPIINLPEVAILGVGKGTVKPVWLNGKFEPRTIVPLAVSYDHRVIDGGTAARFSTDLVAALQTLDENAVKL
jgi:pyruvate dehydrogenase E2 component (dihydrolipoamide acetyltransferase)